MAATMISATAPQTGCPVAVADSMSPISAVPPVFCSASLTGISPPSSEPKAIGIRQCAGERPDLLAIFNDPASSSPRRRCS